MTKILFFIESLCGGGAEKVLLNLVNAMDKSEFEITVQTLYPEDAAKHLAPEIEYKFCYPTATGVSDARMRLEAALGLTYPLHIKGDYDIEVAYLECGSTKIMAGSTNKSALKLAWVHCDLAKKADDPTTFAKATEKYYAKFDKVVCVSDDVRRSFVEMYPDAPESTVIYNCYDDKDILLKSEQAELKANKRGKTCLAVGRLMQQKAFDRLLRVHKRLIDDGITHDLWILGEGPDRSVLEQYISENGLSDSVTLWGFCENPYPFIQKADFLVCSSRYEGFSTVAVEGLILSKTMVTTNCTGMKEIFGESEYGLITDNDDEAFYLGLKRMLTEPGLAEHYAKKAAERGKDFRQETLARNTEAFFEKSLLKKRKMSE